MSAHVRRQIVGTLSRPDDLVALVEVLDATGDPVWLSRSCRCARYTLAGETPHLADVPDGYAVRIECSAKPGKYSGHIRDRVAIRLIRKQQAPSVCVGLAVDVTAETIGLSVLDWSRRYDRLRNDLDTYDLRRIVLWHWARYFRHLPYEDAESAASEFSSARTPRSLATANREASRLLYAASRAAGWRRLTLRERAKIWGADAADRPIWHRDEEILEARADGIEHPTGTGEATRRAALPGGALDAPEDVVILRRGAL